MKNNIAEVALTYKTNMPIEQMPEIRCPEDAVDDHIILCASGYLSFQEEGLM